MTSFYSRYFFRALLISAGLVIGAPVAFAHGGGGGHAAGGSGGGHHGGMGRFSGTGFGMSSAGAGASVMGGGHSMWSLRGGITPGATANSGNPTSMAGTGRFAGLQGWRGLTNPGSPTNGLTSGALGGVQSMWGGKGIRAAGSGPMTTAGNLGSATGGRFAGLGGVASPTAPSTTNPTSGRYYGDQGRSLAAPSTVASTMPHIIGGSGYVASGYGNGGAATVGTSSRTPAAVASMGDGYGQGYRNGRGGQTATTSSTTGTGVLLSTSLVAPGYHSATSTVAPGYHLATSPTASSTTTTPARNSGYPGSGVRTTGATSGNPAIAATSGNGWTKGRGSQTALAASATPVASTPVLQATSLVAPGYHLATSPTASSPTTTAVGNSGYRGSGVRTTGASSGNPAIVASKGSGYTKGQRTQMASVASAAVVQSTSLAAPGYHQATSPSTSAAAVASTGSAQTRSGYGVGNGRGTQVASVVSSSPSAVLQTTSLVAPGYHLATSPSTSPVTTNNGQGATLAGYMGYGATSGNTLGATSGNPAIVASNTYGNSNSHGRQTELNSVGTSNTTGLPVYQTGRYQVNLSGESYQLTTPVNVTSNANAVAATTITAPLNTSGGTRYAQASASPTGGSNSPGVPESYRSSGSFVTSGMDVTNYVRHGVISSQATLTFKSMSRTATTTPEIPSASAVASPSEAPPQPVVLASQTTVGNGRMSYGNDNQSSGGNGWGNWFQVSWGGGGSISLNPFNVAPYYSGYSAPIYAANDYGWMNSAQAIPGYDCRPLRPKTDRLAPGFKCFVPAGYTLAA